MGVGSANVVRFEFLERVSRLERGHPRAVAWGLGDGESSDRSGQVVSPSNCAEPRPSAPKAPSRGLSPMKVVGE